MERSPNTLNILFLTSRLPFPPIGGDRLRTFEFVKHLKTDHKLTIVSFIENEGELRDLAAYRSYFDRLITVPLTRVKSHFNCVVGMFSSEPLQVHYYKSPRMMAAVEAELAGNSYDVVISHLIRMAQYLPAAGPARRWIDFTDAISLYHARRTRLRYRPSSSSIINWIEHRRVPPYERAMIARADRSLFISRADADSVADAGASERITVVPNGVDLAQFPFSGGDYDDNRIVFLGNMRTFPNTDAACFFAAEVFPLIRKERPGATFYIVGTQPSRAVRQLHNARDIIVTGAVESVVPHLRGAAVLVAPMRACSGVQNKILEALAVGTPVVATTMGAEGLDDGPMAVADTPEGIARATLEIMQNPQRRRDLSNAGRAYIERTCTWDMTLAPLDRLLVDDAAGAPPAAGATPPASSIVADR